MVQKMYKRCVSWPLFGEMQYRYIFVWVVCITHLNAKSKSLIKTSTF